MNNPENPRQLTSEQEGLIGKFKGYQHNYHEHLRAAELEAQSIYKLLSRAPMNTILMVRFRATFDPSARPNLEGANRVIEDEARKTETIRDRLAQFIIGAGLASPMPGQPYTEFSMGLRNSEQFAMPIDSLDHIELAGSVGARALELSMGAPNEGGSVEIPFSLARFELDFSLD